MEGVLILGVIIFIIYIIGNYTKHRGRFCVLNKK